MVKNSDIGLALAKAVLSTDPEDSENKRLGDAFMSVLSQLDVHCQHASVLGECEDKWVSWKDSSDE